MGMEKDELESDPDISLIQDSASKCWHGDGSLATDHYLCILRELRKLVRRFHPSMPVVYNSGQSPIKSLEVLRVSGAKCYYGNLNLMVQYETDNHLLKGSSKLCSGTVALWDLNRILGFLIQLLRMLHQKELAGKPFSVAQRVNVYMESLGAHHSPLTRVSCRVAMLRCPGRRGLMKKITSCCHGDRRAVTVLSDLVEALDPIYNAVESTLHNAQTMRSQVIA